MMPHIQCQRPQCNYTLGHIMGLWVKRRACCKPGWLPSKMMILLATYRSTSATPAHSATRAQSNLPTGKWSSSISASDASSPRFRANTCNGRTQLPHCAAWIGQAWRQCATRTFLEGKCDQKASNNRGGCKFNAQPPLTRKLQHALMACWRGLTSSHASARSRRSAWSCADAAPLPP